VPPPPAWLEGVPVVGAKLAARWARAAGGGVDELSARLAPYTGHPFCDRPHRARPRVDVPVPLVFVGVLGGVLAFGIIGLVVGPIVLVVGYSLLTDWVTREPGKPPVGRVLRSAPPFTGSR
jgi:hypothetical protein